VDPSPYEVVHFASTTPAKIFTVPVRSEDAGDPLVGTLVVDWTIPGRQLQIGDKEIPASTFDKTDRKYQDEFKPDSRVEGGCGHTLTALITHKENFVDGPDIPSDEPWDVASVTWQLNVSEDPSVIEQCPPLESTQ
jgi:hypothetical protein